MATHPASFPENSNLKKEHNISIFGLETGWEMKGFELDACKKTITLNISYFLNTTSIRYSRPQISEIWQVYDKFFGYPYSTIFAAFWCAYILEPHQFHPGLILSLHSFCFLINITPIHVVSLHLHSCKLSLNFFSVQGREHYRANETPKLNFAQQMTASLHIHTQTHTRTHVDRNTSVFSGHLMKAISTSTFTTAAAHTEPQQQVLSAVAFCNCIREVPGLNLCWDLSYPHWTSFRGFSQSLQLNSTPEGEILHSYLLPNSYCLVIYQSHCYSRHIT